MMQAVRALAIIWIFLTACGSKQPAPAGAPTAPTVFPAARWVPADPMYVVSAKTMRDAQHALRDLVDIAGLATGREASDVSSALTYLLGVDALSADAIAGIGVDLEGSLVAFSEDGNPTFVAHLSAPEAMTAFIESLRERGMRTQSVVVAGTEVFTSRLVADAHVSWAVDKDWLWVHFTFGTPGGTEWFEHSRKPLAATWVDAWKWAQGLAAQAPPRVTGTLGAGQSPAPSVVGFFKPQGALRTAAASIPAAIECLRKLEAVQRVGLATELDGKRIAATLAFELGATARGLGSDVMPLPPGWAGASANAPMAAQWNLDLRVAAAWAQGCMKKVDDRGNTIGGGPDLVGGLDQYGVRSARAFVHSFDPGEKEGTGAVALDLSHATFFRGLLEQIPGRSTFERSRTFGMYKGKHVSVPFVGAGDYVLDDRIAIAAMGDGLLAKIGTGSPSAELPPIVSIDLRPPGMSAGVWEWIFAQLDAPNPRRIAERLLTWSDLHVGARIAGERVLVEASGNRR